MYIYGSQAEQTLIELHYTEGGHGVDWITGIQRALDYTEAHLTEGIDQEIV
ncbi:hypothetical protein [Robinsoniella sp. KNHs210]|uniref:hypothetical protein n=1 Tax=Robinsoniella sp. KNHs210 TaxID=1469950 RepID=UPI000A510888|nr:hypothetical protein [Robinsoniella sp. KNHs210]